MKVKLIIISIILLLVMVFACGCIPFMEKIGLINPTDEEQLSPEKGGSPDGLVKVLIGFKEKPGPAQQAMVKGVGGKIKYTYHIVDAIAASIPDKAIDALQKNPNIRYVELDGQVYALDDELINTWGVEHIGAGIVHVDGNKGAGVKVAIIDSGVDYTHVDLVANFDVDLLGHDFVNNDTDPMDDDGHGTHVAGTVAAMDNEFGVVGVAPEAKLYALKALEGGSGSFSDVIAALEWCVDEGIQVTNNSYGSSGNPGYTVKDAFDNSAAAGVLHVAAAGNNGNPPGRGDNVIYPAAYDSVIAVVATDQNNVRARWSSTGPAVELAAPGVNINSTLPGDDYSDETWSGTSMASPHVAGTAALVWAAYPGWSNEAVRDRLEITADDLGATDWDSLYGSGLVNAANAAGVGTLPPDTGTIAGNVIDASTNLIIAGAMVIVEGPDLSAITDDNGYYEITNVPVETYTYTVTASVTGYIDDSQTAQVSKDKTTVVNFALTPTTTPSNIMYVNSIDVSFNEPATAGPNTFYTAVATVTVVDSDGNFVEEATVSGHWSGATSDIDSGITDGTGQVSLKSDKVKNPDIGTTFTFTVDDVVKVGWGYDEANSVTTASKLVP